METGQSCLYKVIVLQLGVKDQKNMHIEVEVILSNVAWCEIVNSKSDYVFLNLTKYFCHLNQSRQHQKTEM